MATCPECDAEIEVDEFDVDKGDQLSCPECGSNLEVTSLSPARARHRARRRRRRRRGRRRLDEDDDVDERRGRRRRGRGRGLRTGMDDAARREGTTRAARHALVGWAPSSSPTAAASTAPTSRCVGHRGRSATARSASPPTAPAIRERHRELALQIAQRVRPAARDHPHRRARAARSTAPTRRTAATTASTSSTRTCRASPRERGIAVVVDGNNADDRGDYRPGPPGGARVRRPQPARRSRI